MGDLTGAALHVIEEEACHVLKLNNRQNRKMCDNKVPLVAVSSAEMLPADQSDSNDLKVVFSTDNAGELTDVDVFEMSDASEDDVGRASPGVRLEKYVEFENHFQETLKLNEENPSGYLLQSGSVSNSGGLSKLSVPEQTTEDANTDIEDIDDDGGDIEIEEVEYTEDDLRIIDSILGESGTVDISDQLRGSLSPSPSPSVTPEPNLLLKRHKKTSRSQKKERKKFLSPSAAESQPDPDTTSLHSEDDRPTSSSLPSRRRRRSKSPRSLMPSISPGGITDVEDLELSSAEDFILGLEEPDAILKFPLQSKVSIFRQSFLKPEPISEPDTEAESIALSDQEDVQQSKPTIQKTTLAVSPEPAEQVTDCEEVNFDHEELEVLQKVEEFYGNVAVTHGTRSRYKSCDKDFSCTSSDEEPEKNQRSFSKRRVPRIILQKADGDECSENDESAGVIQTRDELDCLTDREDIKLEGSSDGESHIGAPSPGLTCSPCQEMNFLTDTEIYEDEEGLRPCTPEPDDEYTDERMPLPVRELTILREIEEGRPESVVMPLGDAQPQGLLIPAIETGGLTDTEDILGDSGDDEVSECKSPDLPDIEGGTVQSSDSIKIQKKRSKWLAPEDDQLDMLTDTEDVYVVSSGNKRKKGKSKSCEKVKSKLAVNTPSLGASEVEEIEVSDFETGGNESPALKGKVQYLGVQQPYGEKTDVEDMSGTSGPEEDDNTDGRATPDCLKSYGIEIVTTLEGDGPFSFKQRQDSLLNATVDKIRRSLGTESTADGIMHTDVEEDLMTSTDEEIVRSARVSIDTEQSIVLDKNTRQFNLDTAEEALYVKGPLLNEANTDVEDIGLSEEEITGRIAVIDSRPEVCVCMASHSKGDLQSSVCVCVARDADRLTLVSGNATEPLTGTRKCSAKVEEARTLNLRKNPQKNDYFRCTLLIKSKGHLTSVVTASVDAHPSFRSLLAVHGFLVVKLPRCFTSFIDFGEISLSNTKAKYQARKGFVRSLVENFEVIFNSRNKDTSPSNHKAHAENCFQTRFEFTVYGGGKISNTAPTLLVPILLSLL